MLPGYMKAIEGAGGIPIMLPLTNDEPVLEQLVHACDGLLFTGGHDINPRLYGQSRSGKCGTIIEERDEMETKLFTFSCRENKPMLGICRGIQLFNVMLGGTLYQDVPTERPSPLTHVQKPPYDIPVHEVHIEEGSLLGKIVGESIISVNSYHHQAIKELAPHCHATAWASDGLIEAIEHPDYHYLLAVQWHPEFMHINDHISQKLFNSFIEAAYMQKQGLPFD